MSQLVLWDTERIRLLYFPQQAGRGPRKLLDRSEADVDAQTADMIEQYRNRQRLNGCQGANRVAYLTSAIDVMMKKG
jgi:hypothetical protein